MTAGAHRRSRGQSLIEFAFLAPVLMVLILGLIDLGRGFYYQTELTDATRDAARVLIAPSSAGAGTGPGWTTACSAAERDLANIGVANVSCLLVTSPPPFSYTTPAANQATVVIWCNSSPDSCVTPGSSADCSGNQDPTPVYSPHSCIAVGVAYSFSILSFVVQQIAGPSLLLSDSASMVTLW
jgi:Flp pilus assembly protein TadG